MRGGARLLAILWSLAVVGFGAFFAIIGLATVALGGPERFATWLPFGLVLVAIGLVLFVVVWRRAP